MFLYIMRHGQAEASAASDRQRQLTPAGVQEVRTIANAFRAATGGVQRIVCSPFDRARQTAQGMQEGMGAGAVDVEPVAELASGEDAEAAVRWLQEALTRDTLLVSHVPLVAEIASLLLAGHLDTPLSFQPATILALHLDTVGLGTAEELWLKNPEDWRST